MFHSDLNTLPPIQHKFARIPRDFPGRFAAFSEAAPSAPGRSGRPLPRVPEVPAAMCGGPEGPCRPGPSCTAPALRGHRGELPAAAGGERSGRERPWLCRLPAAGARSIPAASFSQPEVIAAEAEALGRGGRRERLRETVRQHVAIWGPRAAHGTQQKVFPSPSPTGELQRPP